MEFRVQCRLYRLEKPGPSYDSAVGTGAQSITQPLQWESSWYYEFGATRYLGRGWLVSAGYIFNQNSVPDSHYSPMVADSDRHFFSLGARFSRQAVRFRHCLPVWLLCDADGLGQRSFGAGGPDGRRAYVFKQRDCRIGGHAFLRQRGRSKPVERVCPTSSGQIPKTGHCLRCVKKSG